MDDILITRGILRAINRLIGSVSPSPADLAYLSAMTGLSLAIVRSWFAPTGAGHRNPLLPRFEGQYHQEMDAPYPYGIAFFGLLLAALVTRTPPLFGKTRITSEMYEELGDALDRAASIVEGNSGSWYLDTYWEMLWVDQEAGVWSLYIQYESGVETPELKKRRRAARQKKRKGRKPGR